MKLPGHQETGTVLIVDDDPGDIEFARRVITVSFPRLKPIGLDSGDELICYLQGDNGFADRDEFPLPFLVLLDLKMPGMHGFEVLQWLRDHPPHNAIPVVVVTSSGEVQLARRAYELGARSFLTKPLTASEFQNMMSRFRDGSPPPHAIPVA